MPLIGQRIDAVGDGDAVGHGEVSGHGEGDGWVGAKADLAAPAVIGDAWTQDLEPPGATAR